LSNIQWRIASALVLIGTLLPLWWFVPLSFYASVLIMAVVMLWEWGKMSQHKGYTLAVLLIALPALAACFLWWLLTSIVTPAAPQSFFAIIALITMSDVGAYAAGKTFGKHFLAPTISAGKTWEGAIGGWLATVATALLLYSFTSWVTLYTELVHNPASLVQGWPEVLWLIVMASLISLTAQAGDLLESKIKRRFGVKDSSQLIPGHGGVWDRLDGYVLTLPVFTMVIVGVAWLSQL
jgi:phosphatidate cytidylyltransferase